MVTASIIITTYNRPELFKRALKSAQDQTYKDYEIIVVDDCSDKPYRPNQSYKGLEEFKDFNFICHTKNKGLSAARNTGVKAAKGKYIVCLDDDNELMPDFLSKTIAVMVSTNHGLDKPVHYAVAVGRRIKYKNFEDYAVPQLGLDCRIKSFTSIDWGWLISREVFNDIQYDEDLRANEDTDFGIQFHKKFNACVIDEPLTIAYDTPNSLSFPDWREIKGMRMFMNKWEEEYKKYPNELRCLYRTYGRKLYRGGYRKLGLLYFYKSFKAKPCLNSLLNLVFIHFGWYTYDKFMTLTERYGATIHRHI